MQSTTQLVMEVKKGKQGMILTCSAHTVGKV
jgi:hypothetical protein